jgi:hypothetical protein
MIHLLLIQVTKHPTCPKSIDNALVVVIINIFHTMIKGDNTDVLTFWSQFPSDMEIPGREYQPYWRG